ncbi:unnamed protein product [Calicophoron daubneyi]|uniref:Uncharacterized protein n=1 Tax=Calicophoron daubneyi TaxID=300641 RepID=A0AAV2TDR7_CALDB
MTNWLSYGTYLCSSVSPRHVMKSSVELQALTFIMARITKSVLLFIIHRPPISHTPTVEDSFVSLGD